MRLLQGGRPGSQAGVRTSASYIGPGTLVVAAPNLEEAANDVELAELHWLALRRAEQYLRKANANGKVSEEELPRFRDLAAEDIERRIQDYLDAAR